jgi:hypothetical protein
VGYGDTFPVTGTGRLVAVALMLVGISLVGAVTASVAAWFIAQTQQTAQAEEADLATRLAAPKPPSPRSTTPWVLPPTPPAVRTDPPPRWRSMHDTVEADASPARGRCESVR